MDLKHSARLLLTTKAIRGYGDGFTALLLPVYLTSLGSAPFRWGWWRPPPCWARRC